MPSTVRYCRLCVHPSNLRTLNATNSFFNSHGASGAAFRTVKGPSFLPAAAVLLLLTSPTELSVVFPPVTHIQTRLVVVFCCPPQSPISRLDCQLLVKVLQHAGQQYTLQACALVCRSWHTAAVQSLETIEVKKCTPPKATSLSEWLQTYRDSAAVSGISADGSWSSDGTPQLQLLQQQLEKLCDLRLSHLEATVGPAGGDGDGPRPMLCHASTALTRLELDKCKVVLQGLPSLTGLKHLVVTTKRVEDTTDNVGVLAEAIPQLVQLTSLHLGGAVCVDAVLAHMTSCRHLLELRLDKCLCTAGSFTSLPQSLTLLDIGYTFTVGMSAAAANLLPQVTFSPGSTPALCQLTALQSLQVRNTHRFHVAVLSGLTDLTRLAIQGSDLTAGEDEPRLLVLTRLTKLQELVLSSMSDTSPAATAPEDFAAITASAQLTKLELSNSLLEPDDARAVFPEGRHLNKLQHLHLWISWLEDAVAMSSMVRCCQNLQELKIFSGGGHEDPEAAAVWRAGLAPLTGLTRLTYLNMFALEVDIAPETWATIAALSTLRELEMEQLNTSDMDGLMQLTALRQLTGLQLNMRCWHQHEDSVEVNIVVQNKVGPDGGPHCRQSTERGMACWQPQICSHDMKAETVWCLNRHAKSPDMLYNVV